MLLHAARQTARKTRNSRRPQRWHAGSPSRRRRGLGRLLALPALLLKQRPLPLRLGHSSRRHDLVVVRPLREDRAFLEVELVVDLDLAVLAAVPDHRGQVSDPRVELLDLALELVLCCLPLTNWNRQLRGGGRVAARRPPPSATCDRNDMSWVPPSSPDTNKQQLDLHTSSR